MVDYFPKPPSGPNLPRRSRRTEPISSLLSVLHSLIRAGWEGIGRRKDMRAASETNPFGPPSVAMPVRAATWLVLVSLVLASSAALARADATVASPIRGDWSRSATVEPSARPAVRAGSTQHQRTVPSCASSCLLQSQSAQAVNDSPHGSQIGSQAHSQVLSRFELIALPPPSV